MLSAGGSRRLLGACGGDLQSKVGRCGIERRIARRCFARDYEHGMQQLAQACSQATPISF